MTPIPPLTDTEVGMLRESIRRDGVQYPVLLDASGNIIDGYHRQQIAVELGIEYPIKTLDVDAETAERLSVTLNLARRHLSTAASYDLIAWLAERHQAVASAEALERKLQGNKRGGEGKFTLGHGVDFGERGPTAVVDIAERINTDLADMGETMRVTRPKVERAQRWGRASAADKAAARAGRRSVTDIVDPGNKQRAQESRQRRGNGKRTGKRRAPRLVTPRHMRDFDAETRAMYAETQYQSMLNAPPQTLNLPMLRRAEVIQQALDDLLELDPVAAAHQMPPERAPMFPTDTAAWWSNFAAESERRWKAEVPQLRGRRRSRLIPLAERDLSRGDGQLIDWLRTMPNPVTAIEAAVAVHLQELTARAALKRLSEAGLVEVVGRLENGRFLYAAVLQTANDDVLASRA
jgi:hypothetical protein